MVFFIIVFNYFTINLIIINNDINPILNIILFLNIINYFLWLLLHGIRNIFIYRIITNCTPSRQFAKYISQLIAFDTDKLLLPSFCSTTTTTTTPGVFVIIINDMIPLYRNFFLLNNLFIIITLIKI